VDLQENEVDFENECLKPKLENYTKTAVLRKEVPLFLWKCIIEECEARCLYP